ncbi:MAG: glycine cleavage system protein GcvH [Pseudomonadota bacterium]
MSQTRFTEDHEWIRVDGAEGVVGITAYAAEQLGDVVFVELPEVGKTFAKGDEIAVVESVKAASEIYAPVAGEIIAVNDALEGEPAKVNEAPDGEGWFVKIKVSDAGEFAALMDQAAYDAHIG